MDTNINTVENKKEDFDNLDKGKLNCIPSLF